MFFTKPLLSPYYLYIGASIDSLYQMTRWTLSLARGGVMSQGSLATPPTTASAAVIDTATAHRKVSETDK